MSLASINSLGKCMLRGLVLHHRIKELVLDYENVSCRIIIVLATLVSLKVLKRCGRRLE